jgi:hypothetical protein
MTTDQRFRWISRKAKTAFASDSMVFFMAYLAIVAGLPIIIDPSTFAPLSVQTNLEDWMVRVWGVGLFTGGLFEGYGLLTDRPRIERAGLACLMVAAAIFSVLLLSYTGLAALLPSLTFALFSFSSWARYIKLGKVLQGISVAKDYFIVHEIEHKYDEE